MKKFRIILPLLAVVAILLVTVYSSCRKDACSGVACQNAGYCSGGHCVCPVGYSGTYCQNSQITYVNNTQTSVVISVGGSATTIPFNNSVVYEGAAGSTVQVDATTAGPYGLTLHWSFTSQFPVNGNTDTEPLNVTSNYFYLYVQNLSYTDNLVGMDINFGTANETDETVNVPNDGNTYGMGYYDAFRNTYFKGFGNFGTVWGPVFLAIHNQNNATYTITLH